MNFDTLLQNLKGRMGMIGAIRDPNANITYGPAQSRWTREPIQFTTNLPEDTSGVYEEPVAISSVFKGFGKPLQKIAAEKLDGTPVIRVNPLTKDKMAGTPLDILRHESVHSVLRKGLGFEMDDKLGDIHESVPTYNKMRRAIETSRGGYMPTEVPAYAAQRSRDYGFDPAVKAQYIKQLMGELQKTDPKMAYAYGRLAGVK